MYAIRSYYEFGQLEFAPYSIKIDGLTSGHAERTAGMCQQTDHFDLHASFAEVFAGEQFEGQWLQAVADEQGGGLAELDVAGRASAPQDVVSYNFV